MSDPSDLPETKECEITVENLTEALAKADIAPERLSPGANSPGSSAPAVSPGTTNLTAIGSMTTSSVREGSVGRPESSTPSVASSSRPRPTEMTQVNIPKKDLAYRYQAIDTRPTRKCEAHPKWPHTNVLTNYYKVNFAQPIIQVFGYNIEIAENKRGVPFQLRRREECREWFFKAVKKHNKPGDIFDLKYEELIFNDVNILWTTSKLKLKNGGGEDTIYYQDEAAGPRARPGKQVSINIKYTNLVSFDTANFSYNEGVQLTALVDCIMSQRYRNPLHNDYNRFTTHGRSVFFAPENREQMQRHYSIPLGNGLMAWVGLFGAIKCNTELGVLYNCDVSHSVFQKQSYSLVMFYVEVLCKVSYDPSKADEHDRQLQQMGMNTAQRRKLEDAVKGQMVTIRYETPNGEFNRLKKLTGISNLSAIQHQFRDDQNRMTSIAEYFLNKYNLRLRYPHLPCVRIGTRGITYPMEFIYTNVKPQRFAGVLPEHVKASMIRSCAVEPAARKNIIAELTTGINPSTNEQVIEPHVANRDEIMRHYGLDLDRSFLQVKSTLLPAPTLEYGGSDKMFDKLNYGMWDIVGPNVPTENHYRQILEPPANGRLVVPGMIFVRYPGQVNMNEKELHAFTICEALHGFGVRFPERRMWVRFQYQYDYPSRNSLEEMMTKYKEDVKGKFGEDAMPLLFFVFHHKGVGKHVDGRTFSDYDFVKLIGDVQVGCYTQCILEKNFDRCKGKAEGCSTAHNIALKVMAKLGFNHYKLERDGEHRNWTKLTNPDEPTLILGVDVTHPDKEDRKKDEVGGASIGAVVGNIDLDCMQFRSSVRIHRGGNEDMFSIHDEVKERILQFMENTSKQPKHIVVYRDGVGESQFQRTLYEEKESIFQAWDACGMPERPTLTYIVLTKRHHTRFFPTSAADTMGNTTGNLPPGLLVESGITCKGMFDFFLIGHRGRIGTSRPAHYHVLYDDWKPSDFFWQTITFCLSYTFVRCNSSVSQPAPVLYAHLAAKKAKGYLVAYHETSGARWTDRGYAEDMTQRSAIQVNSYHKGMSFV